MGQTACRDFQCMYNTFISLLTSRPYRFYRSSVPVEYRDTSKSYGYYGLYSASVPVQYIHNSTPTMGLLPLQCLRYLKYS